MESNILPSIVPKESFMKNIMTLNTFMITITPKLSTKILSMMKWKQELYVKITGQEQISIKMIKRKNILIKYLML
jgi:hypothetical protein